MKYDVQLDANITVKDAIKATAGESVADVSIPASTLHKWLIELRGYRHQANPLQHKYKKKRVGI